MRRAARVDNNHVECVLALRKAGFLVYRINEAAMPDVWVNRPGSGKGWLPLEIKGPDGELTPAQERWFEQTQGTWRYVVRSPVQAVECANQHFGEGK